MPDLVPGSSPRFKAGWLGHVQNGGAKLDAEAQMIDLQPLATGAWKGRQWPVALYHPHSVSFDTAHTVDHSIQKGGKPGFWLSHVLCVAVRRTPHKQLLMNRTTAASWQTSCKQ
jgi:hypothetical protein